MLDLIEEKDGAVYPVETKHGTAPRDENGELTFWDNDAVQLCAQGLLLEEELGRRIDHGVMFYIGTRERVEVPFDDELRAKTLAAIDLIRTIAARDVPPEPLPAELRHRCFGCSLAPVCLPEETLFQIGALARPAEADPRRHHPRHPAVRRRRRPLPPGARLARRQAQRAPRRPQGRPGDPERFPCTPIRQVVVFGNVQVSTQALETLATNEIPVVYLTGYGRFIAAVHAGPGQERLAPRKPSSAASPTRPRPVPGQGRRPREDHQPADPADALPAARGDPHRGIVAERSLMQP